ncbi:MAG: spore coat protein [Firmicutes bacterium]|nr:spore coat protein [Bacillota bacterium]
MRRRAAQRKACLSFIRYCLFEFKEQGLRDALNHIQKEEQQHGKMIYDYMQANAMYS